MIKSFFYSFLFILLHFSSVSQPSYEKILNDVTLEKIKNQLETLASETMQGRMTGETGQKLAAKYISDHFLENNLMPFFPDNNYPYYQEFTLNRYPENTCEIFYSGISYDAPIFIGNKAIKDSINGEVLFAGYANNENLKGLNFQDKSIFFFSESTKASIEKIKEISKTQSIKTFIVGIPFGKKLKSKLFTSEINDLQSFTELFFFYNYFTTEYRSEHDFSLLKTNNKVIPDLKVNSDIDIKVLFVPEELAEGLFLTDLKKLKRLSKSTNPTEYNKLLDIESSYYSYIVDYNPNKETIKTENVLGYFDCKSSDETIIIGAHYDHVGINLNGSINYGADDNASGTTAILQLAEILSKPNLYNLKLNKDIILIAYTAEELGLLGSEYFVENLTIPMANIDVLINVDMIGRNMNDLSENNNRVFVLNWKGGKKYTQNLNNLNSRYTKLIIDNNPGDRDKTLWTYGSDHYSFVKKNISSITYFTALHNDYHTPKDSPEKINYNKLERIIELIILNVIDIASE